MKFFKNLFNKKEEPIRTYTDFWNWFQQHEKTFFHAIKNRKDIENAFFNKISAKLDELKKEYFFVAGMYDSDTVELILTADGNINHIIFVEEIVAAAPNIKGWKFTALKPAIDIKEVNIEMSGYDFNANNIYFYENEIPDYPDEIDITIVHEDLTAENNSLVSNGTYIFLENYLGELDFLTLIDRIAIVEKKDAQKTLVPIDKLNSFLVWRQKEFIEKYEGVRYNTENDNYAMLEGELENKNHIFVVINSDLLKWDSKSSHPWISVLTFKYEGKENAGLPNEHDMQLLHTIEQEIMEELKDFEGYLNIGRQTAQNSREIFFASKDFRKPSKVFAHIKEKYEANFKIDYDTYKDKYWQSFERFQDI
jgi:hypothetical protein